jgi:hypothetical protein
MRHQLSLALVSMVLAVSACGGDGGGGTSPPWSVGASAQSSALATPGSGSGSDNGTITLSGGDGGTTGCAGAQYGFATSPCTVIATSNDSRSGTYSFDWTYSTKDTAGPGADIFGMLVDGRVVPLSDPGGPLLQSGHSEVTTAGALAFFINCTDCTDGAAQATVTSFQRK